MDGRHAEALGEALEEEGALATEITDADAGTDREQAVFGEPGAEPTAWPRALVSALFPVDSDPAAVLDAALGASGVETLGEAGTVNARRLQTLWHERRDFDEAKAEEKAAKAAHRLRWPVRPGTWWCAPAWRGARAARCRRRRAR